MTTPRRSFLRWTFAGAAGALVSRPFAVEAQPVTADAWLDAIAGRKHKSILDVASWASDGGHFRRTKGLLNALRDSYGASDSEIGVAFGAHSNGLAYLLTPAAWTSLGIANHIKGSVKPGDAELLVANTKNWGTLGADNVAELRGRGVRFLACRNTINRWADGIAARRGGGAKASDVVGEIIAGFHQGVEPVPAMIAATVLAQARGVAYVALG